MSCKRCPHHVRHGYADSNGKIVFQDLCGLKVKKLEREEMEKAAAKKAVTPEVSKKQGAVRGPMKIYSKTEACEKVPFPAAFEYMLCNVYFDTFKTTSGKNDVVPTKDFQYSDVFNAVSITDMELL